MPAGRKKLQQGDVYSLTTPKGLAYLQFIDTPPGHIPCFRVLKGVYKRPLADKQIQKLAEQEHRFITSIPITAARKDPTWNPVGSFILPPAYSHIPSFINDSWKNSPVFPDSWWVVTYTSEGRKSFRVKELSEEQKNCPEDGVSALDLLAERIASGWRPRDWYEKKRWK